MTKYTEYILRKKSEFGSKFDSSELNKRFIKHFNSGKRIGVKFNYGETKRGTIGVTTGWKPVFILMLTSRSMGSSHTIGKKDKVIKK